MNVLALIMAGGRSVHLGVLSQERAESAIPFAGKYRVIDFVLSNCVNSEIFNVGILTQYQPHSLNDHIRTGRPWDLDRRLTGGATLLPPYQRRGRFMDWYRGTADAVYQNRDFILQHQADTVLVLSSEHVYKMDYNLLLHYHRQRQADVTICAVDVPRGKTSHSDGLVIDDDGRVVAFQDQPLNSSPALAAMGIYVFQADVLVQRLTENARLLDSTHDFDRDVLPRMLELGDRLYAYRFEGYCADVSTLQAYWEANMDLLQPDPPLKLMDRHWSIHTRNEERPPVNICSGASVSNSLITDGCVIEGRVESSVLSPGVRVMPGAVVRNSIVFNDCEIGPGAIVDRVILDKNVVVGKESHVGVDSPHAPNRRRSGEVENGFTLVGKNTRLPAGLCVGRECVIGGDLTEEDFDADPQPAITTAARRTYVPAPSLC